MQLINLVSWTMKISHIALGESILLDDKLFQAGTLCKRNPTNFPEWEAGKPITYWRTDQHWLDSTGRYRLCKVCKRSFLEMVDFMKKDAVPIPPLLSQKL